MKIIYFFLCFISITIAQDIFKALPQSIEYDVKKVELGRELFYDPLLSKNKDVSCSSCHDSYGADSKKFSLGTDNQMGRMNSPTVFNLIYNIDFFWNGRASTLEEQIVDGPFINEYEMGSDKKTIETRLLASKKYVQLFKSAYKRIPNYKDAVDAIVSFEKTLITPNSKFDQYLRGEVELSPSENKGQELFISFGCVSCHNGINIGGNSYQKFGEVIPYKNNQHHFDDRFAITKNEDDKELFRVPSLRNVEKTAPYFHDGRQKVLKKAIFLMGYHNVGVVIKDEDVEYIESFLKTFTADEPKHFRKTK